MKRILNQRMIENAIVSISKKDAMEVSSIAWTEGRRKIYFLGLKSVAFVH
jgi:hypothetical protein